MATEFFKGVNILWAMSGTTASFIQPASMIISSDMDYALQEKEIVDQGGTAISWVGYDPKTQATIEYNAADTGAAAGDATDYSAPTAGTYVTLSGGSALYNGTTWIVKSVSEKRTNTSNAIISIRATLYPGIST